MSVTPRRTALFAALLLAAAGLLPQGVARAEDPAGVVLCAVILVSTILTSYAKARAELIIDRMPGGLLERGERVGLLAAGSILGLLWPILWLLALGTTVTAGQRFLYAHREMGRLDREDAADRGEEAG